MDQQPSPRISLFVVVRNEEARLADCVASARGLVDEVVVVDTGSTDRTVDAARGLGACVFSFQWCDDFAAARNEALRHVSGEWVLFLDADERLRPETFLTIERALAAAPPGPVAFGLVQRSTGRRQGRLLQIDCYTARLFRRDPAVYFHRPIHEEVTHTGGDAYLRRILLPDVVFDHTGYSDEEVARGDKQARNVRLARRAVAATPSDPYGHFLLGRELSLGGSPVEARESLAEALRLVGAVSRDASPPVPLWVGEAYAIAVDCCLRLAEPAEAVRTGREGLEVVPSPDLVLAVAAAERTAGNWRGAADLYRRAVDLGEAMPLAYAVDRSALTWRPWEGLAYCQARLARLADSARSYEEAVRRFFAAAEVPLPPGEIVPGDAVAAPVARPELAEGILLLADWLDVRADMAGAYQVLATFLDAHPGDEAVRRRLVDFLVAVGELTRARDVLAPLLVAEAGRAPLYLLAGQLDLRLGRRRAAAVDLDQAVELDPGLRDRVAGLLTTNRPRTRHLEESR